MALPPDLFDEALRAIDRALADIGVYRGRGEETKRTASIICSIDELDSWSGADKQDWATEYVRDSCHVQEPSSPTECLGDHGGGNPRGRGQHEASEGQHS